MSFNLSKDELEFAARTLEAEQRRTFSAALKAHVNNDRDAVLTNLLELNTAMELAGKFRIGHTADLEATNADAAERLDRLGASLRIAKTSLTKAKATAKALVQAKATTRT